jgi:hypothetical protein
MSDGVIQKKEFRILKANFLTSGSTYRIGDTVPKEYRLKEKKMVPLF